MGDIGVKFVDTDSNIDVLSATDEQLAFTTKYFTLKQLDNTDTQTFATSVTIPGTGTGETFVTFTHNLGYKPAYEMYFEDHNGKMFRIPGRSDDTEPSCGFVFEVTNTYIKIAVGYYGGADVPHGHDHVRAILCKIYVESEIQ